MLAARFTVSGEFCLGYYVLEVYCLGFSGLVGGCVTLVLFVLVKFDLIAWRLVCVGNVYAYIFGDAFGFAWGCLFDALTWWV